LNINLVILDIVPHKVVINLTTVLLTTDITTILPVLNAFAYRRSSKSYYINGDLTYT